MPNPRAKTVEAVVAPPRRHWVGDAFPVATMLSYDREPEVWSPFLLLDYAAPTTFRTTTDRRGVGAHPHRGFETVTIAYQGEVEHRDSAGNHGRIGPGDVQWMTAASGVVHEEFQSAEFSRTGGPFEMAQIWVNLPAKLKLTPPRYQDLVSTRIPVVTLPGGAGTLRVIAGAFGGARGPAKTFTPVELWDLHLDAGGALDLAVPEGHTALLLVRRGEIRVNAGDAVGEGHLVRLSRAGASVRLDAVGPADVLVLGGEPIHEPVVGQGPFVMNTHEEIVQAIDDFQHGRMGELA